MDDLTKGLIEHLKKSDPGLKVVETPQFLSVNDFHPMPDDRDTKFLGFADLLFNEIARRYIAMFSLRVSGEDDKADLIAHEIRELIAQSAYDLAFHVQEYLLSALEHKDVPLFQPVGYYMQMIPDLTQWPESSTE